MAELPPGIRLITSFTKDQWYRAFIFVLTFMLYVSFHLSRKPISIVKGELHKHCTTLQIFEWDTHEENGIHIPSVKTYNNSRCGWEPFDKSNYKQLLGALDYSFLCAYAVGMYLSGIIGERLPIRYYLSGGMLASGFFTALFGIGYFCNIHSLWYYIIAQVANGLVQTTGWPSVVTCIGNWFGKGRRGLIMGLWNSHTSVGNILGSLIAGYWVSTCWGLSFVGVVEFSLCLLFAKLVSYTFLFWLPLYITNVEHLDAKKAGDLSTLFDVGGIFGGILAGVISDRLKKRATTCGMMLLIAGPTLYMFSAISKMGFEATIIMLLICGALVNGPYALITTAVSADLGTHKSLHGNAKALSTVTAIIDGTGSIGAALGPLLAGLLSSSGWNNVFYMLMIADTCALLFLLRLIRKELQCSLDQTLFKDH
ncbi:Glycerol-3-phosphate transporter [Ophiophagus hannah]|uniref:Glycerol-3-phosphate transporter n=1 Tax=Ophiophagus hannah TaxID=8665 RepID=V8PDD7_OPHHA|nr:Glycerol-3-phosphate transporter [Ophiophagus hannah]